MEEKARLEELCSQYQHEMKEKESNMKELANQLSILQQTYSTAEKELEARATAYTQLEESICMMREEEGKLRTQLQRMEEEKTEIVTTSHEDEVRVKALEKEREQMSQIARESLEGLEVLQEQFQQERSEKERLQEQLQREKSEKEALQEDIIQMKKDMDKAINDKEEMAGILMEQETKLQTIQETLQATTQERDAHAATLATLTATLKTVRQEQEDDKSRVVSLTTTLEEREAAMASLLSELQAKEAKQQALEAQSKLVEKKGKSENRQLRQTISVLEGEKQKLQEQLEKSQAAVESSERFVKQLQVEVHSLQYVIECTDEELQAMDHKQAFDWDDMDRLHKQVCELRREKEKAEVEATRLREIMEGLRGSYADGYREADALQRELNESEGLLAIARDSYAKATARISELESEVKNYTELAQRDQVKLQTMVARLQEESANLKQALETEQQQREALQVQNVELQERLRTTEGELGLLLHKEEGDLSAITSFTHSTLSPSPRPSQGGEDDHGMNTKSDRAVAASGGMEMSTSDASNNGGTNTTNQSGVPSCEVNGNVIRGLEQVISSSSPEASQKGPAPSTEEMELLRAELKESEEKFLRLQQTMKAKYGEYKAMCERVQDLERQGEELQQYSSQLESINNRLNDNLKVMNDKYKAAKEQISSLKEQIVPKEQIKAMKHVIQTKRKLEEYNKKLMERELVLKEELLQAKRARTKAEQSAQEARLSLQEQEQRAQESEQELSSMRDSLKEAMIKSEQLERDLMEAQNSTGVSTYGSSRSYLENENLKLSVKVDELKQELSEVREQLRQQAEKEERRQDDPRGTRQSSQWMGTGRGTGIGGNSTGATTGRLGSTSGMTGMTGMTTPTRGEEESGRRWSVIRPYHTQGTNGVRESPAKMKRVSDFNADVSNCNPQ